MDIFITLFAKLLPLYVLVPLGYISGRFLEAKKETLAVILIYIVTPVVIFDGTFGADLHKGALLLPVLTFIMCSSLCAIFYFLASFVWKDSTKNILAFTAGTGNTGYFGLPVALMLFGQEVLGVYVLALFGVILYENTVGFFATAKGNFSVRQSFLKVLVLPTVYAYFLGLFLNVSGFEFGEEYRALATNFRGAYTVFGMMVVGIALSDMRKGSFDLSLLGMAFFAKFIVWPLSMFAILWIDTQYTQFFSELAHKVLLLLSIVPLAANTVTLASALKVQPEKASFVVLWSTVFALLYIPLFVLIFF